MPNEKNETSKERQESTGRLASRVRARLYQTKPGTPYLGKDLKTAKAMGGPYRDDYALVLDAELELSDRNDVLAALQRAFDEKAEAEKPIGQSDLLAMLNPKSAVGASYYYMDAGSIWRSVALNKKKGEETR